MPRLPALPLLLLALAGCAEVAADAPALLTRDEIADRTMNAADTARGTQAADELGYRAAQLRARAARLRHNDRDAAERAELLRRAQVLEAHQT